MAPLRKYDVTVNGAPTVMKLTEKDAVRLGGTPVQEAAAAVELPVVEEPEAKAKAAPNKARTVKDKTAGG